MCIKAGIVAKGYDWRPFAQPVVEVMTDKATVEIPAPAAGVVTQLLAEAGDTVAVGSVIFHLAGAGAAAEAAPSPPESAPVSALSEAAPAPAATPRTPGARVLAVPSARRVARELGVDLALGRSLADIRELELDGHSCST